MNTSLITKLTIMIAACMQRNMRIANIMSDLSGEL